MKYRLMSKEELRVALSEVSAEYQNAVAAGMKLDISRGKPCAEQLDLSNELFDGLNSETVFGMPDYRNYGMIDGIPELKKIICDCIGVTNEQLIVAGNASLNLMYDTVQRLMQFGLHGNTPWNKCGHVKFLCPVPGYDRHFAITELFGVEMISVPMDENGPIMDIVEEYVRTDKDVKGMWCVPKYSNPAGIVYSDAVVKKLARMKTAAPDFVIMWDNAYFVHDLGKDYPLTDILAECRAAGNADRVFEFGSTSKITFPGAGVAFMASSEANIAWTKKLMSVQTIGPDKLSQLAHARFLKSPENIKAHMAKHAAIMAPKFRFLLDLFEQSFGKNCDIFNWIEPKGGYFISVNVLNGCAKRVVELCKNAGLTLTGAGATFPLKHDDNDSNLRIAPSYATLEDVKSAGALLVVCVKLAALEKLIAEAE